MSSLAPLVAVIDKRLAALAREIDQLQQTRAALARDDTPGNRSPAPRAQAPRASSASVARAHAKPATGGSRPQPQTRASRTARQPVGRPRRADRRAVPVTAAAIEQLLAGHDSGLSARAIAEQTNADYATTLSLLRELQAAGQVRREGARRSTAWRLISDEERIAMRAAELERIAASSRTRTARSPRRAPATG